MKKLFTPKAQERLIKFYSNLRHKQGTLMINDYGDDTPLFSTRDLKKLKNQAIKICNQRKGEKVSVKDVNKAIKLQNVHKLILK